MPAPSPLSIATSSVQRLVKEETYYHKDLASQQVRIEKLEKDLKEDSADLDENAEYVLKQEVSHQPPPFFIIIHDRAITHSLTHTHTHTHTHTYMR